MLPTDVDEGDRAHVNDRHLPWLDGLRGVAALTVLLHHTERVFGGSAVFSHGYLAVDLFFMMSGFVIGHAYEPRLAQGLGVGGFARRRLERLYPVMLTGLFLSVLSRLFQAQKPGEVAAAFAREALFVPNVQSADGIYRLDGVQWSLLFELVANAVHVAILARLRTRTLAVWTALSAGLLIVAVHHAGSLAIGDRGTTVGWGFVRVAFPYCAGLLLYRVRHHLPPRAGAWFPILFVAFVVAIPAAGWVAPVLGWIVDPLLVIFLFPPLIMCAVRATAAPGRSRAALGVGALSYPLYAVHLPILAVAYFCIDRLHLLTREGGEAVSILLSLVAAALVFRFVDRPVRRLLKEARLRGAPSTGTTMGPTNGVSLPCAEAS